MLEPARTPLQHPCDRDKVIAEIDKTTFDTGGALTKSEFGPNWDVTEPRARTLYCSRRLLGFCLLLCLVCFFLQQLRSACESRMERRQRSE